MAFNEDCYSLRDELKALTKKVADLRYGLKPREANGEFSAPADVGEMIANLMLAYRHLEDATMRVGKAVQAFDGGTSVYFGVSTMTPIEPKDREGYQRVVFAKDQPQYLPLPANFDGRTVETKWQLSWRERFSVLWRGHLHVSLLTFGNPLQPIKLSVLEDA